MNRSGRGIDQFCFGSTYLQLNPNYRRLERMDPLTWKKEGISSVWSGARGLRKSCCKVCCQEKLCSGCNRINCECKNGPIRGNYDGLVVLACITKDTTPRTGPSHKIDHEDLSFMLEYGLTVHFMQSSDPSLSKTVVPSGRDIFLQVKIFRNKSNHSNILQLSQEHNPKLGKPKKHPAYCVYMAYRLMKNSDGGSLGSASVSTPLSADSEAEEFDNEDDAEVIEELEDKQLSNRLENLEQENKSLKEMLDKLDHGRSWLEERVSVLESIMKKRTFSKDIEDNNEESVKNAA